MNFLKTSLLMMSMTAFFVFAGAALGGQGGMVIALLFTLVFNFFSYWFSDKMVLAAYRATEVDRNQASKLYEIVEKLSKKANLPMPRLYIIPNPQPNAFATGRNPDHAAIADTDGLMKMLDERQITIFRGLPEQPTNDNMLYIPLDIIIRRDREKLVDLMRKGMHGTD